MAALRLFLLCCGLASLCGTASATVMRYLEIEELTRLSTNVFHGEIISTRVYWDESHTRILTAVRVQVTEAFKGAAQRSDIVTITQAGGELEGIRQDYSGRPSYQVGEAVVLFTKPGRRNDHIVIGLKQGKLRVVGAEAMRDFSGITLLEQRAATGNTARAGVNTQPARVQTRLPLNELRQRVINTR